MGVSEENRRRNGHVLVWDQPDLTYDDKKSKSKIPFSFSINILTILQTNQPITRYAHIVFFCFTATVISMQNH